MQDLTDVLNHFHAAVPNNLDWKYSVEVGHSSAFTKTGNRLDLN